MKSINCECYSKYVRNKALNNTFQKLRRLSNFFEFCFPCVIATLIAEDKSLRHSDDRKGLLRCKCETTEISWQTKMLYAKTLKWKRSIS